MPRGSKDCPTCGKPNGPRAFTCKHCGAGFTVQGKRHKTIDVTSKIVRSNALPEQQKQALMDMVEPYDSTSEKARRKKYGIIGKTWQTTDGMYRIRLTNAFAGVALAEHYPDNYSILFRNGRGWEMVRMKGENHLRFESLMDAVRGIIRDQKRRKELLNV